MDEEKLKEYTALVDSVGFIHEAMKIAVENRNLYFIHSLSSSIYEANKVIRDKTKRDIEEIELPF